jgi:hypothetical protein
MDITLVKRHGITQLLHKRNIKFFQNMNGVRRNLHKTNDIISTINII